MLFSHVLLAAALALSIYSQLIMKSRALVHSGGNSSSVQYLIGMAADWRVLSAAGATFLAGVCWLLALQRLELGYAFPFMALSFVLIPVASNLFLGEPLPIPQLVGLGFVVAGVSISALLR